MHSGGWLSFTTYILRGIEEDKCIVLLTNSSGLHAGGMIAGLTKILYNKPYALPPMSIREVMGKDVAEKGVEHAIAQYKKFKTERPNDFHFEEGELNVLGYELLWVVWTMPWRSSGSQ